MRRAGRALLATGCGLFACLTSTTAWTAPAQVLNARASCDAESVCSFSVAVKHPDIGTKHYADRWEVLDLDGNLIATRVLRHPHVHEQPFTRALSGIEVSPSLEKVRIRAHCSQDGFGGREVTVTIKRPGAQPADDASPGSG